MLSSDAAGGLYDAGPVDEKAVRRAALITLRRAICERFPPGPERRAWRSSAEPLNLGVPGGKRLRGEQVQRIASVTEASDKIGSAH
jgi:hypothetical protein